MNLPTLSDIVYQTPRLRVRRFRVDDTDQVYVWMSNPEVARYEYWEPYTYEETRAEMAKLAYRDIGMIGTWNEYALEFKANDVVIGTVSINIADRVHWQAELGWALHPDYQRMGLALEAAEGLLRYGVKLGAHRLYAISDARNVPSIKLMERLGMQCEATFRENVFVKGEWCDEVVYAILAREIEQEYPA